MDIQQLKGFLAVAKEKSFTRAAKKTYRTQSAVSLQIKALEDELETRLFDRIGRKTELTQDGSAFFELVSLLLQDFETLKAKFNKRRGDLSKGEIRIATHEPVITYLLPGPIREFKKQYPEIKIALLKKPREEILASVLNGEVDLGISSLKKVPDSINYQLIGRYDRVLVAPKNHSLAKKKGIMLEDIAKYPLLLPPIDTSTRRIVDQVFKQKGLDYGLALEATGRQAIKTYIELGFGISIFNESLVSNEDKKKFFVANVARYFGQSERGIISRKNKHQPKFLTDFIKLLFKNSLPTRFNA